VAVLFAAISACRTPSGPPATAGTSATDAAPEVAEWFADAAADAGLRFDHFNGMTGEFYYPEIIGPGVALFDMDNDGDLDVFLVQGQRFERGAPLVPPTNATTLKGQLFRNDLEIHADGTRTLRFTNVTAASGIDTKAYGMGVAAADYNNDGCVDLYVTALGRNQLFRNNCDATFTDVSKESGVDDSGWSVSSTFFDGDRDGWLDLYVGHYLNWNVQTNTPCFGPSGARTYCSPHVYRAQPSRLYHNNRDGTFTDVTARAGMAAQFGPALGVVATDVNGDGWSDLYVANDGAENQLWINQRNGTFRDLGLISGVALSQRGKAKAGMGVDAGDFDDDGDDDLFVTNLTGEGHDVYVNDGRGTFENQSARSGLGAASLSFTGFGTAWADLDNDGRLDILTVNGTVQTIPRQAAAHDPLPLRQSKQLFRNLGDGRFEELTRRGGSILETLEVSRGAAFGDVDNDGDIDVLIGNNNGPVRLLTNRIGNRHHWLGLRLLGPGARDALGARVEIAQTGQPTRWRRARSDGSYASANDPRVLVGLGRATSSVHLRVIWPDGRTEEWNGVAIDRYVTLKEGVNGLKEGSGK
jgi:hypothetical protein